MIQAQYQYALFSSRLPEGQFDELTYSQEGDSRIWTSKKPIILPVFYRNGKDSDHSRVSISGSGLESVVHIQENRGSPLTSWQEATDDYIEGHYHHATHLHTHVVEFKGPPQRGGNSSVLESQETYTTFEWGTPPVKKQYTTATNPETWLYILNTLTAELDARVTD